MSSPYDHIYPESREELQDHLPRLIAAAATMRDQLLFDRAPNDPRILTAGSYWPDQDKVSVAEGKRIEYKADEYKAAQRIDGGFVVVGADISLVDGNPNEVTMIRTYRPIGNELGELHFISEFGMFSCRGMRENGCIEFFNHADGNNQPHEYNFE